MESGKGCYLFNNTPVVCCPGFNHQNFTSTNITLWYPFSALLPLPSSVCPIQHTLFISQTSLMNHPLRFQSKFSRTIQFSTHHADPSFLSTPDIYFWTMLPETWRWNLSLLCTFVASFWLNLFAFQSVFCMLISKLAKSMMATCLTDPHNNPRFLGEVGRVGSQNIFGSRVLRWPFFNF